jgi:hypothetical protein
MDHRGAIAHFTLVDQHTDPSFFVRFLDTGSAYWAPMRSADVHPSFFVRFLDTGSTVADIQQVRQMMRAQLALHDGCGGSLSGAGRARPCSPWRSWSARTGAAWAWIEAAP